MIIHFSILFIIIFTSVLYGRYFRYRKLSCITNNQDVAEFKGSAIPWILVFGYIAILAGCRSGMNDTYVYIESFQNASGTSYETNQILSSDIKDKAFYLFQNVFKQYISSNYHAWFFLFSIIESLSLIYILRRECVDFSSACFFFFASTLYYNYFSMMRQWFAVVVLFLGSLLIKKKKPIWFFLLCIVMAQFHSSAYLMIPVYFIVSRPAWSKIQIAFIITFCIALIMLNPLLASLDDLLAGTTYDYVIDAMQSNSGSSAIRIFIAAVPVILAWMYRKQITGRMIDICVNMSIINLLLNVLATFTSGLYVARLSVYTSIYNVILYPYLLHLTVKGKNRQLLKFFFYFFYFLFYIYQMKYQGAFGYSSNILGNY